MKDWTALENNSLQEGYKREGWQIILPLINIQNSQLHDEIQESYVKLVQLPHRHSHALMSTDIHSSMPSIVIHLQEGYKREGLNTCSEGFWHARLSLYCFLYCTCQLQE